MIAAWGQAMAHALVGGSVALALVWLVTRLVRRLPAGASAWLWRLAFAKLIVAFVCAGAPLELPLLPAAEAPTIAPSALAPLAAEPVVGRAVAPAPAPAPATPAPTDLVRVLFVLWLLGVGLGAGRLGAQAVRARRLRARAIAVSDPAIHALAAELARGLGLRTPPALLVGPDAAHGPMLLGVRAPAVLLPAALVAGGATVELRLVLAHELAHAARRDLAWNGLTALATLLFFAHPLVWLAARESRLQQEMAADAAALALTRAAPSSYAAVLLDAALAFRRAAAATSVGLMSARAELRRRILAAASAAAGRPTSRRLAAVLLVLALATLAPWRLTRAAAAGAQRHPGGSPVVAEALSPDGTTRVSAALDGTIVIWDERSHTPRLEREGFVAASAIAFSADGALIAVGAHDRSVRVWSSVTGELLATLGGHVGVVDSLHFSRDRRRLAAGHAGRVTTWDLTTGRPVRAGAATALAARPARSPR